MPRNFSAGLKSHLAQSSTTLTTCWQITRRDGTVHRYTALDTDLTVDGNTFSSIGAPYSPTAYSGNTDLSVDNLELDFLFGDTSRQDILAGLLDDAEVRFWLVNWGDPDLSGKMLRGWVGELQVTDDGIKGELRGMLQRLQQRTGMVVSPGCRYDLGDSRCGVDLEALAVSGTTTGVGFTTDFADETLGAPPAGWTQRYSLTNATFEVAADAGVPGGKTVNIVTPSGSTVSPHTLTLDDVSAADCEVLALVRPHTAHGENIHLVARASGAAGAETYYCAALSDAGSPVIRIGRYNAGSYATVAQLAFAWAANTLYWIRFRVVGETLKVKIWPYAGAEPGAWTVETTNASITDAGWLGFGNNNTASADGDVSWIGFSSNGETVPVPGTEAAYANRFYDITRTEEDGYFNGGLVVFTDGPNAGAGMEVKSYSATSGLITLFEPLFYAIAQGTGYTLTPGCDKRFATCLEKYDNALKFGGEPHLPGYDVILKREQGGVV